LSFFSQGIVEALEGVAQVFSRAPAAISTLASPEGRERELDGHHRRSLPRTRRHAVDAP